MVTQIDEFIEVLSGVIDSTKRLVDDLTLNRNCWIRKTKRVYGLIEGELGYRQKQEIDYQNLIRLIEVPLRNERAYSRFIRFLTERSPIADATGKYVSDSFRNWLIQEREFAIYILARLLEDETHSLAELAKDIWEELTAFSERSLMTVSFRVYLPYVDVGSKLELDNNLDLRSISLEEKLHLLNNDLYFTPQDDPDKFWMQSQDACSLIEMRISTPVSIDNRPIDHSLQIESRVIKQMGAALSSIRLSTDSPLSHSAIVCTDYLLPYLWGIVSYGDSNFSAYMLIPAKAPCDSE